MSGRSQSQSVSRCTRSGQQWSSRRKSLNRGEFVLSAETRESLLENCMFFFLFSTYVHFHAQGKTWWTASRDNRIDLSDTASPCLPLAASTSSWPADPVGASSWPTASWRRPASTALGSTPAASGTGSTRGGNTILLASIWTMTFLFNDERNIIISFFPFPFLKWSSKSKNLLS